MATNILRRFASRLLGTVTVLATVFSGMIAAPASAAPAIDTASAPQNIQQADADNPNVINGVVTDGNGDPMSGLLVQIIDPDVYTTLEGVYADENGYFSFSPLVAGSYKMQFTDPETFDVLAFFDNAVNYDSADLVTVSDTEGAYVEMVIGDPTGVGIVQGYVIDEDGDAIVGATAELLTFEGDVVTSSTTDVYGYYIFDELVDNSYTVCFSAAGYVDSCYGGPDFGDAEIFDLVDGAEINLNDSTLSSAGSLTGTVYSDGTDGTALAGILVSAYAFNGWYWSSAATVETGLDGTYEFPSLAVGEYYIVADPEIGEPDLQPEWYPNGISRNFASQVVVEAGVETADIDFELNEGGSIAVTAYCGDTDTVCETATITVDALDGTLPESSRGYEVTETHVFTGLPDGRYIVRFSTADNDEVYFGGDGTFETAETITIRGGQDVAGIYHVFDSASEAVNVSGTVTGFTGDAVYVRLLGEPRYDWESSVTVDEGWTDETGAYGFTVAPGRYTIQFGEAETYDEDGNLRAEPSYWGGAYRLARATWFDLTEDDNFGEFALPERNVTVSGTVKNTASPGVGQTGVLVTLSSPNGTATTWTTAGGNYSISDLAPGVYTLSMEREGLAATWNPAVSSRPTVNAASNGSSYTLNGTMAAAGTTVEGRVTGSGSAVTDSSVYVVARRKTDACVIVSVEADEEGYYSLTGLPVGTFTLTASTTQQMLCGMNGGYTPTSDSNWMPASLDVTFTTATQTLLNKNFALGVGGKIRGNVTTPDGEPVASGTQVGVYGLSDQFMNYGEVDSDGDYEVVGLPAGAYYVQVWEAPASGPAWWTNNTRTRVPVNVSAAGTTSNVNIVASTGSTVTGIISQSNGRAISGFIQAYDLNGLPVGFGNIDDPETGEYSVTSLPDGPIRIAYTVSGRTFWIGGGTSLATAAVTYVGSGGTTIARELSIPNFGSISGNATVAGLGEAGTVMLIDSSGRQVATTDTADGSYHFANVVPGMYTVRYTSDGREMVWYGNKDSLATAQYFTVSDGAAAEGINLNAAVATTAFTPGVVTTTGTLTVGQVLTAKAGTWTPTPTAIQYRWTRDWNDVAISTASTYTVTAADIGKFIRVEIIVSKSGVKSDYMTISLGRVNAIALTATPTPVIAPATAPKVGTLLTAKPGTWTPATVSFAYQWLRAGVPIDGATASTYTTTVDDIGSRVSVRVVGTKGGYLGAMKDSAQLPTTVAATLTTTPVPTVAVTGAKQPGGVLTATAGSWAPAPVGLTYQWKRAGTAIPGATSMSYTLTSEDVGASITVSVTGAKVGYTSVTKTSTAVTGITSNSGLAGATPTIVGDLNVGATITAVAGSWSDGVALAYQWVRDGKAIVGATSATYTLTSADLYAKIRVRVKGTLSGSTLTKSSVATGAIQLGTITEPEFYEWSGNFSVGGVIVADTFNWSVPVKLTFQWLRDGAPIAGATKKNYTLTFRDLGKEISVQVTASAKGYTTVVFESDSALFTD